MVDVSIALGANWGDPLAQMQQAVARLSDLLQCPVAASIYRSQPKYVLDQPEFYNSAMIGQTHLSPLALIKALKQIEHEIGRIAREVNGPREIDLDIVTYGNLCYEFVDQNSAILTIPHPRMAERAFVLKPLCEIAPHWCVPGYGTVQELTEKLPDLDEVVPI
jgi:2-amino-4-hydroxy-6-hydroxymethyldihydropteridine diphosphokinase